MVAVVVAAVDVVAVAVAVAVLALAAAEEAPAAASEPVVIVELAGAEVPNQIYEADRLFGRGLGPVVQVEQAQGRRVPDLVYFGEGKGRGRCLI